MRRRGAFVKLGSVCVLFGGFLGKLVFDPRALCPRQLFFTADTFSRDSFTPSHVGASRAGHRVAAAIHARHPPQRPTNMFGLEQ
jgi:hypothetical protein